MGEMCASQAGTLAPGATGASVRHCGVNLLLFLWPFVGLAALFAMLAKYQLVDHDWVTFIGGFACLTVIAVIKIAWRKERRGDNNGRIFPNAVWVAIGSLFVPAVLFLNGALDHSAIEQHQVIVIDSIESHDRGGSTTYYLELTSWRAGRRYQRVKVSEGIHIAARPNDVATVETHRGALGIPLLVSVSVHRPY
jgi:hypothetical protein